MVRAIAGCVLLVALGAATACDTIDSDDLNTGGIYPTLTVTATGNGQSEAIAVLRANSATSLNFVDLGAGDALTVSLAGVERSLQRNNLGDYIYYNASFDTAPAGEPYTFALSRTEEADAPESVVELPAAFELTADIGADEVADVAAWQPAAESLGLTWDVSGQPEPLTIDVLGPCVDTFAADIPTDSGTYQLTAGLIVRSIGTDPTCTVQVKVTRQRSGTVDGAFNSSGRAAGLQERSLFIDVAFPE